MITNHITNIAIYKSLLPLIAQAIDFIENTDLQQLALGKHVIVPDKVTAFVNQYDTKVEAECLPESHRQNIDIQVMIKGRERFRYETLVNQEVSIAYDADSDVMFYKENPQHEIVLNENECVIFFPFDIHQPELQAVENQSENVVKMVIKIKV